MSDYADSLNAGRVLDSIVAREVMNWINVKMARTKFGLNYEDVWFGSSPDNDSIMLEDIPHYSTEISQAWKIIEKLIHPRNPQLAQRFEKILCASHFHLLTADKAAFEISKAGLKAVMNA